MERNDPQRSEGDGPSDLVLRRGRVITMDAERRIISNGTIAIRQGVITWVGPDSEWMCTDAAEERELRGAVVHPGLIDAHVHTGTETVRGIAPKGDASWQDVESVAFIGKTEDDEEVAAIFSAMDMVSSGTTLFADTGGSVHLNATVRGIRSVGMRGIPGRMIVDQSSEPMLEGVSLSTRECLETLVAQLDEFPYLPEERVHAAVTLVGMGLNSDALLREAALLAREREVPLIMHQSWSDSEVRESLRLHGVRPVMRLSELGVLGPNTTLVHAIQLDQEERLLVRETGTNLVHCPSASLRRAMGALRLGQFPELIACGANVALGSDGLSGPRDLLRQAYLAAMVFRELRAELPTLTAETVLEMATINGARALGMADEVGSIEVGKRADLVVHSTQQVQSRPLLDDPVDWLVFYSGGRTVETVLVDGEPIFDRGRFTRIDQDRALDRFQAQVEHHVDLIGRGRYSVWPLT